MPSQSNRLVAVNTNPSLLDALRTMQDDLGIELITVENEVELRAVLTKETRLLALGLDSPRLPPELTLEIAAAAGSPPPVMLIGDLDTPFGQRMRTAADDLGIGTIPSAQPLPAKLPTKDTVNHTGEAPILIDAAELRRGLDAQQFTLQFQPKLTVGAPVAVSGVEALVRWDHPELGLLLPSQFLPVAEASGLLSEITDFTITEAIQQYALWRDQGRDVQVAVNLAPALVKDAGFPDRLLCIMRQFDMPPSRLSFDVKEMTQLADRALCLEVFTRLRAMGVGLALDDYGIGLSSITELYRMPFTEVKIDGALIADASCDAKAGVVMRAIVRLAHELSMVVTAEGVETDAQLDYVIASRCDFVQGALLCEPRRPGDLERFLADTGTHLSAMNRAA